MNISAAAEVIIIFVLLRRFSNIKDKTKSKITDALCFALLLLNILKYLGQSFTLGRVSLPVEFSAIAYFAVPIIMLLRVSFLRVWAVYSSLLAGSGYFFTFTLFGDMIYKNYSTDKIITAMFCHGILLFIGLSQISFKKFSRYTGWILTLGLCMCVTYSFYMSNFAPKLRGVFMYELIFGFAAVDVFGKTILPLYYLLVVTLFSLSLIIFYKLNEFFAKK